MDTRTSQRTRWLSLVGIGDDGLAGLGDSAKSAVAGAEIFIGGERHLSFLPGDGRTKILWTAPLDDVIRKIRNYKGEKVCVLASGDPFFYGIGAKLAEQFPIEEMNVLPAPSSLSLALSRLGWSFPDIRVVTLHGRPLENLIPHLIPGARLIILSENRDTPRRVAEVIGKKGYGDSALHVFSRLGGLQESRVSMKASELASGAGLDEIQDLNLIAAEVAGEPAGSSPHLLPGLDEALFLHDGQITKKEIRILTLAALGPMPKNLLWDVGAGAGSISIEWLRVDSSLGAIAIEPREERVENLVRNRLALGVPRLQVVQGRAPECLEDLPDPDAIFVGGGLSEPGILEACWARLKPGGRLVANAVTLEGEAALVSFSKKCGGELIRLEVSRAEPIGRFGTWRPQKSITQLRAFKDGPEMEKGFKGA
jgi:precorrin-6Y C5,15-methyltransferase (decarboxylating)